MICVVCIHSFSLAGQQIVKSFLIYVMLQLETLLSGFLG
jgi:hypothetical protein